MLTCEWLHFCQMHFCSLHRMKISTTTVEFFVVIHPTPPTSYFTFSVYSWFSFLIWFCFSLANTLVTRTNENQVCRWNEYAKKVENRVNKEKTSGIQSKVSSCFFKWKIQPITLYTTLIAGGKKFWNLGDGWNFANQPTTISRLVKWFSLF